MGAQLAQAAVSVLAGALLGLYYDLLRLPRALLRGSLCTALCDFLFCLGALLGLFTLGLGPGEGELRIFMLLAAAAGFLLWERSVGHLMQRGTGMLSDLLRKAAKKAASAQKMRAYGKKICKKLFPSAARWFTIRRNRRAQRRALRAQGKVSAAGPGGQQ